MIKTYVVDGIEYTVSNKRMRYNPEFHENHGKPWTVNDLAYLCSCYENMKLVDIAMALGRTPGTVAERVYEMRKKGEFEHYKQLGKKLVV